MRILLNFSLLLLMLVAALAVLGGVLMEKNKIRLKTGPRYARFAATLVTALAYWMTQNSKVLSGISDLNLLMLLGFLWVLFYYMVWGVLVYQYNKQHHRTGDGHSSMLSMLYIDSHPDKSQANDEVPTEKLKL
jgi:amino acid transporter